jgi:hypothetical protein
MGNSEYAIFYLSLIIEKKFKDINLAKQTRFIAQSCTPNAEKVGHADYKTIKLILKKWDKKYSKFLPK